MASYYPEEAETNLFPPQFTANDFAGFARPQQMENCTRYLPDVKVEPRAFADESLKLAKEFWEMDSDEESVA